MLNWMNGLRRLVDDEEGQDMVEYAFLIVFIAIAAVAAMLLLPGSISTLFNNIGTTVDVPASTS
jgi:Flp pilus assembly pilin Flp